MSVWLEIGASKENQVQEFGSLRFVAFQSWFQNQSSSNNKNKRVNNYLPLVAEDDEYIPVIRDVFGRTSSLDCHNRLPDEYVDRIRRIQFEENDLPYIQFRFESDREEIEALISHKLSGIAKVEKIYSFQYDESSSLHFQVLTSNERYDRDLMMRLLEIEYDLGNKYKLIDLSFEYIPKVFNSEKEVVVERSKLIYKKDKGENLNEFFRHTSTASISQQTTGEFTLPL